MIDGVCPGVHVDVTLVDEQGAVVWSHSGPCALESADSVRAGASAVDYRYDTTSASVVTASAADGSTLIKSVVLHGEDGRSTIVGSWVWISLASVNARFNTAYT